MKNAAESKKSLIEYYEDARESFVAKMRSEDDERSNLKFKIAAFVIHELSYSTPEWFKNHFMTYIAKNCNDEGIMNDKKIIRVENAFYDVVADYLIKMESEVEYVKKVLAPCKRDEDKKDFWKPIVFDAFLIVGIYFTPSMTINKKNGRKAAEKKSERNVDPRYLNHNHSAYKTTMSIRLKKNWLLQEANP